MKKILILFTDLFNTGGLQAYNQHLCQAIETEFSKTKFLVISLRAANKKMVKNWHNINVQYCWGQHLKLVQKIVFITKTALAVFMQKPNFLICAHINMAPLGLLFKNLCGLQYTVMTQGVDVWDLKRGCKYHGLKKADLIITVSRYTKERMVKNGICSTDIKFLRHAVDTSVFFKKAVNQELRRRLALGNKRILLTVGRISSLERYKGHDIMLEVLRRIGDEYVWIVIGSGDDLAYLQEKAKNLGISERIRFLGEIQNADLIDYYNLCDVFIMPSKGEGFGIVFLEAMACGKPVVAGNRDGSNEPLLDGKLGFMVNPDSVEEIIEAINLAITAREDRTNPEYLMKELEANFGISVFNKKVKETFADKLS